MSFSLFFKKQVNDRLKGHKKINQQATLEYAVCKNTLDDLNRVLYRLNEDQMDCVDLIESVESQKNDAIQYSLMQVARGFRSMFRTLVPFPAIGYMEWIYGDDDDSGSDLDAEDPRASYSVHLDENKIESFKYFQFSSRSLIPTASEEFQ